jgi:hypothetical protein
MKKNIGYLKKQCQIPRTLRTINKMGNKTRNHFEELKRGEEK